MKITRVQRVQSHRVFRDFIWTDDLTEFATFNLVYGWNCSGKTTLSSLFQCLNTRQPPGEGEFEFYVGGKSVTSRGLQQAVLPQIRVFNRNFVNASIFEVPGQQFSPIYYLGEDSIEKQKQIEALRKDLEATKQDAAKAQTRVAKGRNELETFCTDQARLVRELLSSSGGAYNNYDKRSFRSAVQHLKEEAVPKLLLDESEKKRLKEAKDGTPRERIEPLGDVHPDVHALTARVRKLIERSVVSRALEELTQDSEVASWVSQGLHLHTGSHESKVCRFCGEGISSERIEKLRGHFNDEFTRFASEIRAALEEIANARRALEEIRPPERGLLYEHLGAEYKKAIESFSAARANVFLFLDMLTRALQKKQNAPFQSFDLLGFVNNPINPSESMGVLKTILSFLITGSTGLGTHLGMEALKRIDLLINQHNGYTENFYTEVTKARSALEDCYVAEGFPTYQQKVASVEKAIAAENKATQKIQEISAQIVVLERAIRQHRRPADELTSEIAAYLGHGELTFTTQEAGYTITRGGAPALNLSEGERTAIAFLYFLKSLADTSFDRKNGVVVIDDPVSSLDSNSIYSAFGFMKERTKDVGQLFVLTHNFPFFRQVKNWFNHQTGQNSKNLARRPSRFYMLSTTGGPSGQRSSSLRPLDPLLHEYESEYHYLFKRVHDEAHRPARDSDLATYYGMPNIARRLLEAFLAFRLPGRAKEFNQQLELIDFDPARKAKIIRFLHTHSHHGQIAEPEHDPSALAETAGVLRDVLALIESADPIHYSGMMSLLNPVEVAHEH